MGLFRRKKIETWRELIVTIEDKKLESLIESFPEGWKRKSRVSTPQEYVPPTNYYSFDPPLTGEQVGNLTSRLVELGAYSFKFARF